MFEMPSVTSAIEEPASPAGRFSLAGARHFLSRETGLWASDEGVRLIFVGKVLLASALALWIGFRLDLGTTRWSVVSIFIIMQPESGMVLEKGFYQFLATLLGCAVSLALVGAFAQHGPLFFAALSVWVAICVCGSLHTLNFGNFRAYGWALASYTTFVVGLPAALNPDAAFAIGVTRVTEITLGIACSGIVSALVFPLTARDRLRRLARSLFEHFSSHVRRLLPPGGDADDTAQQAFMDAIAEQDGAMSAAAFDDPRNRGINTRASRMNRNFLRIATRLHMLRQFRRRLKGGDPRVTRAIDELDAIPGLIPTNDAVEEALAGEPKFLAGSLRAARDTFAARARELRATLDDAVSPDALLDFDTHAELTGEFLSGYARYAEEYAALPHETSEKPAWVEPPPPRVGWALVGIGQLRAFLVIVVLSTFWILTDWEQGVTLVTFGGITAALAASAPRPALYTRQLLIAALMVLPTGFLFLFFLLPEVNDFASMFLMLAPFLALGAYLISRPQHLIIGLFYGFWFMTLAATENNSTEALSTFIDQSVSSIAGIAVCLLSYKLFMPAGSRWLREREKRELRRQVTHACFGSEPDLDRRFEHETRAILRKIALNQSAGEGRRPGMLRWSLAVLETGGAMIEFRRAAASAPPATIPAADRVRATVARAFESPSHAHLAEAVASVASAISLFQLQPMNTETPDGDDAVCYLHLIRSALLDPASPLNGELSPEALQAGELARA